MKTKPLNTNTDIINVDMIRRSKTIYLEADVCEHLSSNVEDIHKWFNEKYKEDFMSLDSLKRKEQELKKQLESTQTALLIESKRREAESKLDVAIDTWFSKVGIASSDRHGLKKTLAVFNSTFHTNISIKKFKFYLDRSKTKS